MELPKWTKFHSLIPVVRGRKGTHHKLVCGLASERFVRVRENGEVFERSNLPNLDKNYTHTIEIVINRLINKPNIYSCLADYLITFLRNYTEVIIFEVFYNTLMQVYASRPNSKYNSTAAKIATFDLKSAAKKRDNLNLPEVGTIPLSQLRCSENVACMNYEL